MFRHLESEPALKVSDGKSHERQNLNSPNSMTSVFFVVSKSVSKIHTWPNDPIGHFIQPIHGHSHCSADIFQSCFDSMHSYSVWPVLSFSSHSIHSFLQLDGGLQLREVHYHVRIHRIYLLLLWLEFWSSQVFQHFHWNEPSYVELHDVL